MPTTKCGFEERPDFLLRYGPTLGVRVGFDSAFNLLTSGNVPNVPGEIIPALVDTGAYASCIDKKLVAKLDLPFVGTETCGGIDGQSKRPRHLAQIIVSSLGVYFYGAFIAVDLSGQPHNVLIGRDFLRGFRMIYEGHTGSVLIENKSDAASPS